MRSERPVGAPVWFRCANMSGSTTKRNCGWAVACSSRGNTISAGPQQSSGTKVNCRPLIGEARHRGNLQIGPEWRASRDSFVLTPRTSGKDSAPAIERIPGAVPCGGQAQRVNSQTCRSTLFPIPWLAGKFDNQPRRGARLLKIDNLTYGLDFNLCTSTQEIFGNKSRALHTTKAAP